MALREMKGLNISSAAHKRIEGRKAIDSETISKIQLIGQKNINTKHLSLVKARQNAIQPPLFCISKPTLFGTVEPRISGLVGTTRNSPDNRGFG